MDQLNEMCSYCKEFKNLSNFLDYVFLVEDEEFNILRNNTILKNLLFRDNILKYKNYETQKICVSCLVDFEKDNVIFNEKLDYVFVLKKLFK